MSIEKKIAINRIRQARFKRAEKVLRAVRQRIFDYEDAGKYEKAQKVIATCQRVLRPKIAAERAAAEDRRLQRTPSYYEAGSR